MFSPSMQIRLSPHLRFFYKCCYFLGLIHFRYNPSTKRFEHSTIGVHATFVIYNFFKFTLGFVIFSALFVKIYSYVKNKDLIEDNERGIDAQDSSLALLSRSEPIFTIFIYSTNYLTQKRRIRPLLNEILTAFHEIHSHTQAPLRFDSSFLLVLALKVSLVVLFLRNHFIHFFSHIAFLCINLTMFVISTMKSLMFFSHVFSQLTLVGFYLNMSDFLASAGSCVKTSDLKEFIAISLRLHELKERLDGLHVVVFTVTFVNLVNDVFNLYSVLKLMFYATHLHMTVEIWEFFIGYNNNFFAAISGTFDVYMIGLLSQMLVNSEREFQRQMLELVARKEIFFEKNVELMLYQSWIYKLETRAYRDITLDSKFSFDFTINSVVLLVIAFLQFFAGARVYSTN